MRQLYFALNSEFGVGLVEIGGKSLNHVCELEGLMKSVKEVYWDE